MNRRMQKQIGAIIVFVISFLGMQFLTPSPEKSQPVPIPESELFSVVRIVDGDTLVAASPTQHEVKIRMLGINTPESVDPRKKVECFGKEASTYLSHLIAGKDIILESDSTQDDKDKYGRLLRFVFLPDGTSINEKMIADGYAYEYTYHLPYRYQNEFKLAQANAREQKAGLWADSACGGRK